MRGKIRHVLRKTRTSHTIALHRISFFETRLLYVAHGCQFERAKTIKAKQ